ncbi:unnamed protein product [Closterium sp. NIES-65]|nr:unnamed protein product [Closterium sp. NIES-65]
MYAEGRHIVILLDNASSHTLKSEMAWSEVVHGFRTTCMSNIPLVFLPPNTTAFTQPLDQGIIATAKARYRQHWMRNFTALWAADGATSSCERCSWRTGCLPHSWAMELSHVHDRDGYGGEGELDGTRVDAYPDIDLDEDIGDVGILISRLGLRPGAMPAAEYVAIDEDQPTCAETGEDPLAGEPGAGVVAELWEAPTTMQAVYEA